MSKARRKTQMKKYRVSFQAKFGFPRTPYGIIRKTRKTSKEKIEDLSKHIAAFYIFLINIDFERLRRTLQHGKTEEERDILRSLLSYNEVMTPTLGICIYEFHTFLSELQAGAYNGSARTLRCILETATEACEFQSRSDRPTYEMLTKEFDSILKLPDKKRKLRSLTMRYNAWVSFLERLKTYEETKRIAPSFLESVNRLNSRQIFHESPQLYEDLKRTYEILSDYVHPSSAKIETLLGPRKHSVHLDFDSKEFGTVFEFGLKTLDAVQFLYVKSLAHFLGYGSANEFLEYIAKSVGFPSDLAKSFLQLPFSKKLSNRIIWRTTQPKETPKSQTDG